MGFFIGWKYFDDKDYYSSEAQAERNRLREEKADRERKAAKKAERRQKEKRAKKEAKQEKWREESQKYYQQQFGLDGYSDGTNYINSDADKYKDQSQNKYGSTYHSTDESKAPSLNRGLGAATTTQSYTNRNGNSDRIHKMGELQKRRPFGMDSIGMDKGGKDAKTTHSDLNPAKSQGISSMASGATPGTVQLKRPF